MRPTANFTLHAMLAAVLMAFAATSAAAGPAFLKFGGVEGDTTKGGKFEGQLEVESFSWGETRAASAKFNEFTIRKVSDRASPAAAGGVQVPSGDIDGDGTGARKKPTTSPQTITPRPLPSAESGLPTGKRQHKPMVLTTPLDKGSVWVRVSSPWAGCRVGDRYSSLELNDGGKRYALQDVTVANCGGSSTADRPTEEIAFYYNRIAF